MSGDLPRASAGAPARCARLIRRGAAALVLASLLATARPFAIAAEQPPGLAVPDKALRALLDVRRAAGCTAEATDDRWQEIAWQGRPAIEIKGRERGGDAPGTMRDLAYAIAPAGRVVTYVCFANASTRRSGEAIISLAEVSGHADRFARALLPGANLELESIKRHRAGVADSIYYEARYASAQGDFPFLEPPVRLLLNATTASLFRLDIDPDWIDPGSPPRLLISRKAAERIAMVTLRERERESAFGSGVALGAVSSAEMYTVRPNDWLGFFAAGAELPARVAWVVPFRIEHGDAAGLHHLFVDAATGRILGGLPGSPGSASSR